MEAVQQCFYHPKQKNYDPFKIRLKILIQDVLYFIPGLWRLQFPAKYRMHAIEVVQDLGLLISRSQVCTASCYFATGFSSTFIFLR